MRRSAILLSVTAAPLLLVACPKAPDAVGPNRPSVLGDKCNIETEQTAPLIVDWSSSERSRLEAAALRGTVVAVKVSACDIEPLWQCETKGRYAYASATSRRESERIADDSSLYARVPVSAVSLEAKLAAGGELSVDKTTVGRFESDLEAIAQRDLRGPCEGATHFVSAVDVGAFEFNAFRSHSAAAQAQTATVGAGGQTSSEREVLSADGDLAACAQAGPDQPQPPAGCGAPIQVELTPLSPSLDLEQWRQVATAATKKVMRECSAHGSGTSELWLLVEPSGAVRLGINETPFPGNDALNFCVRDVWESVTVAPFSGPPLAAYAYVYVYPPDHHSELDATIDKQYRELPPGIPSRVVGDRLGYQWERYGITPTDQFQ